MQNDGLELLLNVTDTSLVEEEVFKVLSMAEIPRPSDVATVILVWIATVNNEHLI